MQMRNSLTGSLTVVDTEVVSIRGVFLVQRFFCLFNSLKDGLFLVSPKFEKGLNMAPW